MNIREIQVHLTDAGFSPGALDGDLGPKTKAAIAAALERYVPGEWSGWSEARRLVAVEQVIMREVGRLEVGKIDGLVGPQTSYARLQWQAGPWRDRLLEPTLAPSAPASSPWPLQKDVERFYGARGTRQVQMTLPYPMRIAWDPDQVVRRFSIHELVAPSAERALVGIRDHYGLDGVRLYGLDLWGGCLNVRKMRGGSAWSMHSWGIAIDFDPERNQLSWGRPKALLSGVGYLPFWQAWEAEGWVSLGQERDSDWMHVQAARLT